MASRAFPVSDRVPSDASQHHWEEPVRAHVWQADENQAGQHSRQPSMMKQSVTRIGRESWQTITSGCTQSEPGSLPSWSENQSWSSVWNAKTSSLHHFTRPLPSFALEKVRSSRCLLRDQMVQFCVTTPATSSRFTSRRQQQSLSQSCHSLVTLTRRHSIHRSPRVGSRLKIDRAVKDGRRNT